MIQEKNKDSLAGRKFTVTPHFALLYEVWPMMRGMIWIGICSITSGFLIPSTLIFYLLVAATSLSPAVHAALTP